MLVRVFRVTDKLSNATLKSSVWMGSGFLRQSLRLRQTLEISIISLFYTLYIALNTLINRFFMLMRRLLQGSRKAYEKTDKRRRAVMAQRAAAVAAAALERAEKAEYKAIKVDQRRSYGQMAVREEVTVIEDPLRTQNRTLSVFAIVLIVALIALVVWSTEQQRDSGIGVGFDSGIILQNTAAPISDLPTRVPSPTPVPNPLNWRGTLVFSVHDSGQDDLYALQRGDTALRRLTNTVQDERDPVWSPDGRTVAFVSNRDGPWELYVMDVVTKQVTRLTYTPNFEGSPTWSPDGIFLAYEYYDNERQNIDIFIVPVDNSQPPQRLTASSAPDIEPAWRPGSGREIAYTSWRNGQQDIFIISLDNPSDEAALNVTGTPNINENHPAWSQDGRLLAYTAFENGIEFVSYRDPENSSVEQSIGRGRMPTWNPVDASSLFYIIPREQQNQTIIIGGERDGFGGTGDLEPVNGIVSDLDWSPFEPEFEAVGANVSPLFVENSRAAGDGRYGLAVLPGINAPDAYLNAGVDASFNALRSRVIEETARDYLGELEDAWWRLDRAPEIGQSRENWHYAGRAFALQRDLIYQGTPPPMVVVREDDAIGRTYWRVYLRVSENTQNGSLGRPLRELPWDFSARTSGDAEFYEQGGKLMDSVPPGYYIDFTQLAADYGWERVSAVRTWRVNTPGILYWQFVKTDSLEWREAMRELYTEEELSLFLSGEGVPEGTGPDIEGTEPASEETETPSEAPTAVPSATPQPPS